MKMTQIASLVNNAFGEEVLGESLLQEDLSNVVDVGNAVFGVNSVDKVYKKLIDQIAKIIFEDRIYSRAMPDIYRDSYEFGCVVERIKCEMPDANENPSWALNDGESYDPNVFTQATVSATFYTGKTTFEITIPSVAERQVKSAFQNAGQLSAFLSMLMNACKNAMTVRFDGLILRTINSLAGETVYDEFSGDASSTASSTKAINLLWEYNELLDSKEDSPVYLTADTALKDREFLRYANFRIKQITDRLKTLSTMYNVGGRKTFTSDDKLRLVLHTDFVASSEAYMKADIWHEGYIPNPSATVVPYFQGTGAAYDFEDTSMVDIKTGAGHEVKITGLVGVAFDYEACGIANTDTRVTSNYNARAEFTNSWMKADASFFNDLDFNCVVFYMADTDHTNA